MFGYKLTPASKIANIVKKNESNIDNDKVGLVDLQVELNTRIVEARLLTLHDGEKTLSHDFTGIASHYLNTTAARFTEAGYKVQLSEKKTSTGRTATLHLTW